MMVSRTSIIILLSEEDAEVEAEVEVEVDGGGGEDSSFFCSSEADMVEVGWPKCGQRTTETTLLAFDPESSIPFWAFDLGR